MEKKKLNDLSGISVSPNPQNEAKKVTDSTGMLISFHQKGKMISLYVEADDKLSSDLFATCLGENTRYMEHRISGHAFNEFYKTCGQSKTLCAHEIDAYIIAKGEVWDNILTKDILQQCHTDEECISGICYIEQESCEEKTPDDLAFLGHIYKWMQQRRTRYLEFTPQGTGSDNRSDVYDTEEDGGAADMESQPLFFKDPSQSRTDPKKSPEFLRFLNKILRSHNCLPGFPPGYVQDATSQPGVDDLEVDLAPDLPDESSSRVQPEPDFFGQELYENKQSKPRKEDISIGPLKQNEMNFGNVRYLLQAPAAVNVLQMGYEENAVLQAISNYTRLYCNVEFDVNDLLTILEKEDPKPIQMSNASTK